VDENLQRTARTGPREPVFIAFSPSDSGRRSSPRKDTASASLRAQGSRSFRLARSARCRKLRARTLHSRGPRAGLNLQRQKAKRTGGTRTGSVRLAVGVLGRVVMWWRNMVS
jgi:hypothetical protein